MEDRRKWLLSSAAARQKAEKESKLYYATARFVCDFYLPETEEEHKVLDVVSSNIIDIYSNYEKVFIVKKHNEDDVSEVIKEYRSKVENELNYFFENMINVATKQAIKDFIECRNISSIIKEHRSKVEEELTYVCNNVSDVTIKQAFSQLLADFQSGPKPKDPPSQV
ncbi:hypothetical protein CTI12_AA017210 [Artemisia annua]|uniref:Uncharacterized protein n=1 Tax=Artemisia annua TaxID=35608 RepID=A0A2U1QKT9_ARTAN|nr:hypothetical protein CTI12_AA017210 [Artemisia annua]